MHKSILVLTGGMITAGLLLLVPAVLAADNVAAGADVSAGEPGALQKRVAASFVQTGRQHLEAGRAKEAVEDFTAALSFDPAQADARKGLVLAQAKLGEAGRPAEAAKAGEAAAGPVGADVIRAQASLKVLCESARQSLARGDNQAAVDAYEKVLAAAKPLARRVDVASVITDATRGLKQAREALRAQPEPKPEPKPEPAPAVVKAPSAGRPAARPALDDDYGDAMEQAMREIHEWRRPQTQILKKAKPSLGMGAVARRIKDHTTQVISHSGFRGVRDEEAEKEIMAKLVAKKVNIHFKNQSFASAIEYIRAASDVNILIDPSVLPTTTPITDFPVVNMKLRNVLDWLVRFQKLDYRIRDGAIFISNREGLAEKYVSMIHDIADLTVTIKDFSGRDINNVLLRSDDSDFVRMGIEKTGEDTGELDRDKRGAEWARFIRENVRPSTWAAENAVGQNTIAYRNGKLVVTHTPEVQEQIRELLSSFRKARAIQVAILARFVEISENFLQDLGVNWTGLGAGGGIGFLKREDGSPSVVGSVENDAEVGLGTAFLGTGGLTMDIGFLNDWAVNILVTAVRKQNRGNILTAPRVTCFNTQRAFLTVSTIRSYVRSYDSDGNPEIGQVNDGIILEVQPFVSADRRYITLELIPQVNQVGDFTEFAYRSPLDDDEIVVDDVIELGPTSSERIQLPEVTTRQIMTTVSVPDGGTLMIGGLALAREGEGEATVPILGDLPLIKHLFTSRRKLDARRNLIILVTAHIIQQDAD